MCYTQTLAFEQYATLNSLPFQPHAFARYRGLTDRYVSRRFDARRGRQLTGKI